ncbi:MAG: class I SAM-dependent methyltransferase [Bacteroidia bacterium]
MKNYISLGDFIDIYYKIKQKGWSVLANWGLSGAQNRVAAKWNHVETASDFWTVPRVRQRWNEKCTGDKTMEYADFVAINYLSQQKNLQMLSIGCGTGAQERKFAKYPCFAQIEGMDLAENLIQEARALAKQHHFEHLSYTSGDFYQRDFQGKQYDVILFNASLHHFDQLATFIPTYILPILKVNGYLILFEYVGANRLQWTEKQLTKANELLKKLPNKYKIRTDGKSLKIQNYRPGIWRMLYIDPSESIDSESIMPVIHQHFEPIIEKKVGGDLLHILLKDIAHHFVTETEETSLILNDLFQAEDDFMQANNCSDFVFGIYQPHRL